MSDKTYVGRSVSDFESHIGLDVSSLEETPAFPPYSKVILWVDEETSFVAGDDSGRTMEAALPWANQTIANDVLAKINGFVYCPFSATDANVNPAVELGDGATVAGIYSPLAAMTTVFDPLFTSEISAPYDEEIDHEYPYVSPTTRELRRKVALGRSYYGTRITRANGWEIVKVDADGAEKSRAKFNSDVLAFYDDNGVEALYFDAAANRYRFVGDVEVTGGSINVNDKFIVHEDGSVEINGPLSITGGSDFIQVRYSTNKSAVVPLGWSKSWDDAWSNTYTEVWAIYSYDNGNNWTAPILTQGKTGEQGPAGADGEDGAPGSDADVPAWVKAYTNSAEYNTLVNNEWVVTMNLYGSKIYGSEFYGNEFNVDAQGSSGSFNLYGEFQNSTYHFFEISYYEGEAPYVHIDSPGGGFMYLGRRASALRIEAPTYFYEVVDFSGATVTGLDIVFG